MNLENRKFFQYVIASVALHLIFMAMAQWAPPVSRPAADQPIEFQVLESSEKQKSRQVVTDPELERLQKSLEELEKTAKHLSRQTRRVQEEQIAQKTDHTKNRPSQKASDRPPLDIREELAGLGPKREQNFEVALEESTISEYIPDVRQGGFTSLNTDQFLFYTFYARINEQLRNRWVQNIRQFTQQNPIHILNELSRTPQITEVEVLLKPNGEYVKSIIHRRAGHTGLDQAVVQSFLQAHPFHNPPEEIVSEDGYIHLKYAFYLTWRPRSMASGSR